MNPEKYRGPLFAPYDNFASLAIEPEPVRSLSDTVVETVRDEHLRDRLLELIQVGGVEQLCAMPAIAAADVIGVDIFGMTPRKAALLYGFVKINKTPIFEMKLEGRRKIPHFTPTGLLAYVGMASEDAKGVRRGKLLQRSIAAVGDEIGRHFLYAVAKDGNGQGGGNDLLGKTEKILTGDLSEPITFKEDLLGKIPIFDERGLKILDRYTRRRLWQLHSQIQDKDRDIKIIFPPATREGMSHEFIIAQAATFICAANKCSLDKNDTAMRRYDPFLKDLTKGQLKKAYWILWGYLERYHEWVENAAQVFRMVAQQTEEKNFWRPDTS